MQGTLPEMLMPSCVSWLILRGLFVCAEEQTVRATQNQRWDIAPLQTCQPLTLALLCCQPPDPCSHNQLDAFDVQVTDDVADRGVLAAVVRQAQSPVGINRVQTLLL